MSRRWLLEQTDQLVAAGNFTIATAMIILGTTVFFSIRKLIKTNQLTYQSDLFFMLTGIVVETFGWALHRLYWGTWRVYKLYENDQMDRWFVDNGYFALIPVTIVLCGLVLILGPLFSIITNSSGRWKNMTVAAFLIVGVSWFSYWQLGEGYARHKKAQLAPLSTFMTPVTPSLGSSWPKGMPDFSDEPETEY